MFVGCIFINFHLRLTIIIRRRSLHSSSRVHTVALLHFDLSLLPSDSRLRSVSSVYWLTQRLLLWNLLLGASRRLTSNFSLGRRSLLNSHRSCTQSHRLLVLVSATVFHRKQKIFFFFGWRLPLHTALGLVYWWGTLLLLAASKIKNRPTCNKNTLVAGVVMHGALHSQFLPDSLRYFQIWLLFCTQKYHNLKKWGLYRIHIHFPIAHTVRRKTMKSHAQRYDIIIRHGIIHTI